MIAIKMIVEVVLFSVCMTMINAELLGVMWIPSVL